MDWSLESQGNAAPPPQESPCAPIEALFSTRGNPNTATNAGSRGTWWHNVQLKSVPCARRKVMKPRTVSMAGAAICVGMWISSLKIAPVRTKLR